MYKKIKLNKEEKKILPTIIMFVLIQILIIAFFCHMWEGTKLIDIKDTEQIDITVEKVYRDERFGRRSVGLGNLIIISDSVKYVFDNDVPSEGYPIRKLHELISKGDTLTLIFIRKERYHTVVAAKTETETYRTLEGYNHGRKALVPITIIFSAIVESIFLGALTLYFLGWSHHFKSIRKKMKKNAERRKKYKESLKSNN